MRLTICSRFLLFSLLKLTFLEWRLPHALGTNQFANLTVQACYRVVAIRVHRHLDNWLDLYSLRSLNIATPRILFRHNSSLVRFVATLEFVVPMRIPASQLFTTQN
jgi:hypothetical protein